MVQPRAATFVLHQYDNSHKPSEDRISKLPDEILVTILSRLTIEEAGRTSVLSHRWEYLWTSITVLNFDVSNFDVSEILSEDTRLGKRVLEIERSRYVCWVNQVLKSHLGPTIEEFRIVFDLTDRCNIDSWIKFAIERNVQRLELDLLVFHGRRSQMKQWYTFPTQCLGFASFKSLTALQLKHVKVTEVVFNYFLSNCPFLEQLCVIYSSDLVNIKVAGPSLKLKYLEICHCARLESIEISAKDLVSFKYDGKKIRIEFKNVPCLVEVLFGPHFSDLIIHNFSEFSGWLSHLKTLKLALAFEHYQQVFSPKFPVLQNLKHLELKIYSCGRKSLLPCMSLIKACPFLYSFTLEAFWSLGFSIIRELEATEKCPHKCLKVVEFVGFAGITVEIEAAMYLIENAVSLEKIIINPCLRVKGKPFDVELTKPERRQLARERARQLGTKLHPGTKLVIL
ncbi:hypothetical protein L1049_012473 [Liquidambar formosana]|uniref:F-box domain-containing protein n=1 Tax=Liquidambar formosana TaxID=63359 RepID=A0AAP0QXJ1_LIQFO